MIIMQGTKLGSELIPSQDNQLEELEITRRVVIEEVVHVPEIKRVRGRVVAYNGDEVHGWISLLDTETGYIWAEQEDIAPGMYTIIQENTRVTSNQIPSQNTEVGTLQIGMTVEVLQVEHILQIRRIRGRIRDPPGWISLLDTEGGIAWAERQDECIEFRDADGDQNLFRIDEEGRLQFYSNSQLVLMSVKEMHSSGRMLNFQGDPPPQSVESGFEGVLSCEVAEGDEDTVMQVMYLFQKTNSAVAYAD
jgi:hypothetical protein